MIYVMVIVWWLMAIIGEWLLMVVNGDLMVMWWWLYGDYPLAKTSSLLKMAIYSWFTH